jgi:hypothetical protein
MIFADLKYPGYYHKQHDRVFSFLQGRWLEKFLMTIAQKRTRLIRADDIEYRWIVQPDDEPGLEIVMKYRINIKQSVSEYSRSFKNRTFLL